MNSRERIKCALEHKQPDILPVDFGSTSITGIHVSMIYKLRQYYGLDAPNTPVIITEPFQMLGEIKDDLKDILGVDCIILKSEGNAFGFNNECWKEWKLYDGTPVLVPEKFNTEVNCDGSLYQYPQGDKNSSPSAKMPKKGFFFDALIRQKSFKESDLDPDDNLEEYGLIDNVDLEYLKNQSDNLYNNTEYSIVSLLSSSEIGNIAFIPGMGLKEPKGIRDVEEWYISLYRRKDHVKRIFEKQTNISIENLKLIYNAVGNKISIINTTGTDFGTQQSMFLSVEDFRYLFKPYHKRINEWIHQNTDWKIFIHTCGAINKLIPDLIDVGFDILNPVQISAERMDPKKLKKEFGRDIVFWGGGVDTQRTLPLCKPEDVKSEVRKLIEIFSPGGGFVFNTVHNIQANVPLKNVIAMIETIQEYR